MFKWSDQAQVIGKQEYISLVALMNKKINHELSSATGTENVC